MIKIQINKIKFNKVIFAIFFFLAPFTVSGYYQNITPIGPTSVLIMELVFVYTLIYLFKKRYILLDKFEFKIIFLFLFPIIFSFMGILFQVLTNNNIHYNVYMKSDLFNRLILIAFNITILAGLLNITKKWSLEKIKTLIKYYYYGVFLFSLIGFWQFLHFLFDIPYLNIETRSFVYGVSTFNFIIGNRLTSLANEPSFFAPLIIDLVLLAIILKRKPFKTITLGVLLLIFSYSAGGYFNFSIVIFASIVAYIKYKNYYLNKKYFFIIVIFVSFTLLLLLNYSDVFYKVVYPVIGRLNSIFDIKKTSRIFMILMPFYWVFRDGIVNSIFGYGPGSFKVLSLTEKLPNGNLVHVTSNNFFSDTVFELGYLGFMSYVYIFYIFFIKSYRGLKNDINMLYAFILSVHLFTSSIYRADFMQARFWILIFFIIKLLNYRNYQSTDLK